MKRILSGILILMIAITVSAYSESAASTLQEMYTQAELSMATGDYGSAAAQFEALGAYSDASQMAMYCKAIMVAETLSMYDVAVSAFNDLGDFKDSKQMATYYTARSYQAVGDSYDISSVPDYDLPEAKYSYDEGAKIYAGLALFKDCLTRMSECQAKSAAIEAEQKARLAANTEAVYQEALTLEESGEYQEAINTFKKIQNYQDSEAHILKCQKAINEGIYQEALAFEKDGKYQDAISSFNQIEDYKDSKEHINECKYQTALVQFEKQNYADALSIFEELSAITYKDSKEYFDLCYDLNELQTNRKIETVGYFDGGIINAEKNGLWGHIDTSGHTVVAFQWESAGPFSEGLAVVRLNGKEGYINRKGEIVIPLIYTSAVTFVDGYATVQKDGTRYRNDGAWYKIDKSNNIVEEYSKRPLPVHDSLQDKFEKQFGSKYEVGNFINGYAVLVEESTKKQGCINENGEIVIPCEYDRVGCGEGYFALIKDGYLSIIDKDGNVLY